MPRAKSINALLCSVIRVGLGEILIVIIYLLPLYMYANK